MAYILGEEIMEEPKPRDFIPEEYKFAHEYCFFLHDILANIVISGEQEEIFHHSFKIKTLEDAEQIKSKSGEELASWMEQNGYRQEFQEANRRHIFIALLSDFCQFVYEALNCSRKGKLTVTYALLRKPLKENLFYLEWLLADSPDFINLFHSPILSKDKRPLPLPTELSKEKRLEIIGKSIKDSGFENYWISPDFLYELRYDKKVKYGFEGLFQRATHLITTIAAQTEEQNFNFIFSGEEEKISQWQGLYTILPLILLHTVFVAQTFVEEIDEGKLKDLEFLRLRAMIGFLLYGKGREWDVDFKLVMENLINSFSELKHLCLGCHETIDVDFETLELIYDEGVLACKRCGYKTYLTSRKELLFTGHLMQGKINCPNCNAIVLANEENIKSAMLEMKVICQECKEEIEFVEGDNSPS